jgi:hypothetical protein
MRLEKEKKWKSPLPTVATAQKFEPEIIKKCEIKKYTR